MNIIQEICNAISMTFPSMWLLYLWYHEPLNINAKIIIISSWTHMPISFTYHMMCGLSLFTDKIDNWMRKLDQSFIHVCCITSSYALSNSIIYGFVSLIINLSCIHKLWIPGIHDISINRRINIVTCIYFYLFPIIMYGNYVNYFKSSMYFIFAAASLHFNDKLYGWGHSIQHLLYTPYAHHIIMSTRH